MDSLHKYCQEICDVAEGLKNQRAEREQQQSDLSILRIKHTHPELERIYNHLQTEYAQLDQRTDIAIERCKKIRHLLSVITNT